MRKIKIIIVSLVFFLAFPSLASNNEKIHIIANPLSGVTNLEKKQVLSIFLGRARNFPNGLMAKPFDYEVGASIREAFFEKLTGKKISDIDAYWARLSYSGRAFPPKSLEHQQKILNQVKQNKHAISYIRGMTKEDLSEFGVNVVYTIEES